MSYIVTLIHDLAWPVVALIVINKFREPLGRLIEMIGRRATGIAVASVKIEFAQLSKPSLPTVVIDPLAGTQVGTSGVTPMAKAIQEANQANYLMLDIGPLDDRKWLTSRLYILATILEHVRRTRCIVFTSGNRYIGTAVPREIRWSLGLQFPSYEKAFASVLGGIAKNNPINMFRRGLADEFIDQLLNTFVSSPEISSPNQPALPDGGWIPLPRNGPPTRYENSEWISPDLLYDMLRDRIDHGIIADRQGRSEAETIRLVLEQTGRFVVIVDDQRKFKELIDRSRLAEQVGREAARELADGEADRR
jgi:hypothetical protein